jgi:5-methylcytosine-specific restriction protein A
LSVCSVPGCPEVTKGGKCQRHKRERWRKTNASRPSPRALGYKDPEWVRVSREFRRAFPICQWPDGCLNPSEHTHHLDGKGPNGPRGKDWGNLQALCQPHHSVLTGREVLGARA